MDLKDCVLCVCCVLCVLGLKVREREKPMKLGVTPVLQLGNGVMVAP